MKTAIDITKYEIKWHEENRGDGPDPRWEEAFIAGLKHLLDLFERGLEDHPSFSKEPTRALHLSELDTVTLDELCWEFREAVFKKARESQPPRKARFKQWGRVGVDNDG
jgi:hypothetical protein